MEKTMSFENQETIIQLKAKIEKLTDEN